MGQRRYRAERWDDAVSALETTEGLSDALAAIPVIHAMSQWQLGNLEEARQL